MSKFDIFTLDIRVILSIIVATGVYALLLKFLQKNHHIMFKRMGVGGQRFFLTMFKTELFLLDGFSYKPKEKK